MKIDFKLISIKYLLFLWKRKYRTVNIELLLVDVIYFIVVFKIIAFEDSSAEISPKRRKLLIKESLCSKILERTVLILSKRIFLSCK